MKVDPEVLRGALASDLEHWINRLANTRTGSAHHRVAQRELTTLVMRERAIILAVLRAPQNDGAAAMRERALVALSIMRKHITCQWSAPHFAEVTFSLGGLGDAAEEIAGLPPLAQPDSSQEPGTGGER